MLTISKQLQTKDKILLHQILFVNPEHTLSNIRQVEWGECYLPVSYIFHDSFSPWTIKVCKK